MKMREKLMFVAAFLCLAFNAGATTAPFHPENPTCVRDAKDPYDPGATMHFGSGLHQCADTNGIRAVAIISENENEIVAANFRFKEKWWVAKISKHDIESVSFQWIRFDPYIPHSDFAHAQLHFVMNKQHPVVLTSQVQGQADSTTLPGFVVTSTSFKARDTDPGAIDNVNGNLGILTFLTSWDSESWKGPYNGKPRSADTALGLDLNDRIRLMSVAIGRAEKNAYKRIYSAGTSNCNTSVFDVLDEAFPPLTQVSSVAVGLSTLFNPVIGPAMHGLNERGLTESAEVSDMTCVSNQSLRLNLDLDQASAKELLFVKIGLNEGELDTISISDGTEKSPIDFGMKGDRVETVRTYENCQGGMDPQSCASVFDFNQWDQVIQRIAVARARNPSFDFDILARRGLTAVLANEATIRGACTDFGSDLATR